MKSIFIFLIKLAVTSCVFAQGYNIAAGLRMGTDWGITGKYRFDKKATAEVILQSSFKDDGLNLTALVEKHQPLISKRFNFYIGGGLHKGWINNQENEEEVKDPFGVTAIAGIEFNLGRTNLSWDFKPAFNLAGGQRSVYTQSGLSLRYVIEKRPLFDRKKKKKRKKKKDKDKFNWKFWENWDL